MDDNFVPVNANDLTDLNPTEMSKVNYLIQIVRSITKLNTQFGNWAFSEALASGTLTNRHIDWHGIRRFCAPSVLLITIIDTKRGDVFNEIPGYAMIPRLERIVDLSEAVPQDGPGRANRETTERSLDHLRTVISSMSGSKGENAMKHLNVLVRMTRSAD